MSMGWGVYEIIDANKEPFTVDWQWRTVNNAESNDHRFYSQEEALKIIETDTGLNDNRTMVDRDGNRSVWPRYDGS